MPGENEPDTTVSRERYEAAVRERDSLKSKVTEATNTLVSYQKRDAARKALKGKVDDPDSVADLITPFLNEVEVADVANHIASDGFKPRLAAFKPPTATTETGSSGEPPSGAEGEGEPGAETAATEPASPFSGPSPGQDAGTQSIDGNKQSLVVGSDEWKQLIREDKRDVIDTAYKEGRVVEVSRPYH